MNPTREPLPGAEKILVYPPKGIPRDLMVGFLSRCRGSLDNLSAVLSRGEFEAVRVFGHRLKGTGGAYGLPKLTEMGTSVERAASGKNSGELQDLVAALETYLSKLEVAVV